MGGELGVDSSPSQSEISSYSAEFKKWFPYFLSLGMTYDEYWNQDCTLVKAYQDAEKIKRERTNTEAWLQGMYIYEALCDVSPIIHAFAKAGTKPLPYPSRPYALTEEEIQRREEEEKEKKLLQRKQMFANWAASLDLPESKTEGEAE